MINRRTFTLTLVGAVAQLVLHGIGVRDASAQYDVVASQFGTPNPGAHPTAGLTLASDGNYYGTTTQGGAFGFGTVFRMTPAGAITIIHSFDNTNGANPHAPVIEGADGNLYGTTNDQATGSSGVGTIFTITKQGSGFAVLHSLAPLDPTQGCYPEGAGILAPLVQGINGLYGVIASGSCANTNAAFFRISPTGTDRFSIVGHIPDTGTISGLTRASDGLFYGTTEGQGFGVIYRISEAGVAEILHTLIREEGYSHPGEMIQASDGKFYGTASSGGASDCGLENCGTMFQFDPATLTYHTMHSFSLNDPAGRYPVAGLAAGSDGLLYGTTAVTTPSGADCCGTIFSVDPSTDFLTRLYTFNGSDGSGSSPRGRLIEPSPGQFLGTAYSGGFSGFGVVFSLTLANATTTTLNASPNPTVFGQEITLTATVTASGNPSGNVEFLDGNTSLGTAQVIGGTATLKTTGLAVGGHTISAAYAGDGTFLPSESSAIPVTVNRAQTTTTLESTPNPSTRKQLVTLTATVVAVSPGTGTATGQVQLMEGKKKLGTASLVNGVATFQVAFSSIGEHELTATYGGDGHFAGSASAAVIQTVNK
jgi:uncharacterized repeat protein (TIGR03803 family)